METFELTRFLFLRALALIYCVAFAAAINQFRPLCGERGLLPVPLFLKRVSWREAPSLFCLHFSDRFAATLSWLGLGLSLIALSGIADNAGFIVSIGLWFTLWILYLSFVNVGQTWYSFGWETLLLETGFLAIFLSPAHVAAPEVLIWLVRWLLFRLMFGAGLIKIRSDTCWWDLTCLHSYYQTQPMPNPLSWYFHYLPGSFQKFCVVMTHVIELIVPFFYFAPAPFCYIAGILTFYFQFMLIVSGNLSWLNYLTLVLTISCFDDAFWMHVISWTPAALAATPMAWDSLLVVLTIAIVILSIRPAINLFSADQRMNASFDPLHIVNTYGAFGSITRRRFEVIVQGTTAEIPDESAEWLEYEFRGKPGDVRRCPPIVAPYHLRLGWLLWFAAMAGPGRFPWFTHLIAKLLVGDKETLGLLRINPFPDAPPTYVRAELYEYEFTKPGSGSSDWWTRRRIGEYLRPYSLEDPVIGFSLTQRGWEEENQ